MKIKHCILLLFISICFEIRAEVKVPALVGNGMVLQRDTKIPIWGWASPGEKIIVTFNGSSYRTLCNENGKWKIAIKKQKAGGPYEMAISGENKIIIKDILIGDVWICGGQSNMAVPMGRKNIKAKYTEEIANAKNNYIRQFTVSDEIELDPIEVVRSGNGWVSVDPSTIETFTAVGYFFAKQLYSQYKVPIGLINSNVGGTPAQAWISLDGLKEFPNYIKRYNALRERCAKDPNIKKITYKREPTVLYNGKIAPLIPYAIKGVIWYQGEGNRAQAHEYSMLFPRLIKNWREKWGQGNFPFIYVQLANCRATISNPSESEWAELREAQLKTLSVRNTAMAVTIDIGEGNDIHPANKEDVGIRLSFGARKVAYDENKLVHMGPIYKSMEVKDNKVIVSFIHTGGGLKAGNEDRDLKQFAIADENKKFVWANAKIEGNKVIVWNDKIKSPVAVRYAWADNPEGCNLYNKEGLPASPFRTDDWKGITK